MCQVNDHSWRYQREMSGYQPRSLREEISFYQLRLDPAVTRCDKVTSER